jgi:hypothetical protein
MSNNNVLNRAFSKKTFIDLIEDKSNIVYTSIIKRYLDDNDFEKNSDAISEVYNILLKTYRNEYIYKNTLLNKLLLGRHSLRTTTALTEVPISKSKADFILINGSAIVYEIKTELDSLDRLKYQLDDYYKAFNKVCVITSESYLERVTRILEGSNVGICVLTRKNTISEKKGIVKDGSHLDYEVMFKVMRKKEYEEVLKQHYSYLPDAKPVKYYSECYDMFKRIDIDTAYKYMINILKKRNKVIIQEFKDIVPKELSSLIYFSDFKESDYYVLEEFLNKDYRGL